MNMLMRLVFACLVAISTPVLADPPARIADLGWLEGSWEGEGIGGMPAIEVYSRAADGALIGHFRQLNADGSVMFYELITIAEVGGSLSYNVKHFNADLTGWEEKDVVRRFRLSATAPDRWEFSGLTYQRGGADSMSAFVTAHDKDGKEEMLEFRFRRMAR